MKQLTPVIFLALFLLLGRLVCAQDLLYLRNAKEPIKVKVHEIGLDEIKYKPWGDTVIPILVLPRENVKKLVLANGSVFEFSQNPMADRSNYRQQHPQALKINFLSPLFANTAISYERSIKPGRSYEIGFSVIGLGLDQAQVNPAGMYLRGGYKFISTPDFYIRGMRYNHILRGGYVKPELILGAYSVDGQALKSVNNSSTYSSRIITIDYRSDITFGAMMVNFGKQWVYDNQMLFDLYFGLGYGFSNISRDTYIPPGYEIENNNGYNYAFAGGVKQFPLAFTLGFKLGFVFGKPQSEEKENNAK
jgi:hypothetical protein